MLGYEDLIIKFGNLKGSVFNKHTGEKMKEFIFSYDGTKRYDFVRLYDNLPEGLVDEVFENEVMGCEEFEVWDC